MACTPGSTGEHHPGCSKRPSSKAAASEEARRTLRYVEPLRDARTKLAGFFSILLEEPALLEEIFVNDGSRFGGKLSPFLQQSFDVFPDQV
jgi:hypothetical protein